ncbi:MAG: hypothetical protein IJ990_03365 [Alistipes sp.]|nr:hypothetical protein [Alistipes sp.]
MKKYLLILFLVLTANCFGQSREFIRNAIKKHGECRNVAITRTNGDLMLYGRNGWAATGCPEGLTDALDKYNEDGDYIDDVQLTEDGDWLILVGNNGFQWNNIPYSLELKLREFNEDGEVVLSVTFNDNGEWIIISRDHFAASNEAIRSWLKKGNEKHGMLWAACITDDAAVAVYANGYSFMGNVPSSLKTALEKTKLDVFRLKIAGTSWFFADKDGEYEYSM